jgi:hypothetical protein
MRRARLEGWHIGRPSLELDREGMLRDRQHGRESRTDRQGTSHLANHRSSSPQSGKSRRSERALKTHSTNRTKQTAGSHRSGCSIRCGLRNTSDPRLQ